jgi:hypothetical protein
MLPANLTFHQQSLFTVLAAVVQLGHVCLTAATGHKGILLLCKGGCWAQCVSCGGCCLPSRVEWMLPPCHLNQLRGPVTAWENRLKPLKVSYLQHKGPQQTCSTSRCCSHTGCPQGRPPLLMSHGASVSRSAVTDDPGILHVFCSCSQQHTKDVCTLLV